ncbi:hypothetical protein ScPMuIL_010381, partial [Solemya velum]
VRNYKCDLRESAFSLKDNIRQHQVVHTGEKLYKCDLCESVFTQKGHLRTHQIIHT